MKSILKEPLERYLIEKTKSLADNYLAGKFRHEFPLALEQLMPDKIRYKTKGSAGQGNWTDCPWIAILDTLITDSPQKGYYPVFLFKANMKGVYLSLNQGVSSVVEDYKKEAKKVLRLKAKDFRAKINYDSSEFLTEIKLESNTKNAKLYEAGNIIAKYYPNNCLPNSEELEKDVLKVIELYNSLVFSDNSFSDQMDNNYFEEKQIRLHWRVERNKSLAEKVKNTKGYSCQVCGMNFKDKYGDIGDRFIEAHHLKPISELGVGRHKVDLENDFAVLCSNCHSMIHRLDDPSDLNKLRELMNSVDK